MTDSRTADAGLGVVLGSDVTGLPVVPIDLGDDVAEIRDVVFDSASHHLVGFTLNKRGWLGRRLALRVLAQSVRGIGSVVTVGSVEDMVDRSDAPTPLERPTSTGVTVGGSQVTTDDGAAMGSITDLILETGPDPSVVGYQVSADGGTIYVPIDDQLALSSDDLILSSEARTRATSALADFAASVSHDGSPRVDGRTANDGTTHDGTTPDGMAPDGMADNGLLVERDGERDATPAGPAPEIVGVRDLAGRRVLVADTAESLGDISRVVLARDAHRATGLEVGSGRSKRFIRWTDINALGADAVLVSQGAPDADDGATDLDQTDPAPVDPIGSRVLSTAGHEMGSVVDVHLQAGTGAVVAVITEHGRYLVDQLHALGTYALMVSDR